MVEAYAETWMGLETSMVNEASAAVKATGLELTEATRLISSVCGREASETR